MDGWRATPRNSLLGAASDGLRSVRGALDKVPLPEVLGGGLGQLLIGKAPEEVNEWSYGNSPLREIPQGPRLLPQFRSDRGAGVVDTALLPVAETLGLAKLGNYGLRKMGEAVGRRLDTPVEAGRREFLQQTGALTGAAAAGAAVPPMVKGAAKLMDAPVEEGLRRGAAGAAARTVARATPAEFYTGVRALEDALADRYVNIASRYEKLMDDAASDKAWMKLQDMKNQELAEARKAYQGELSTYRQNPAYSGYLTNDELERVKFANPPHDFAFSKEYTNALKETGRLSDSEIRELLMSGKTYTDPITDARAGLGHVDFHTGERNVVWRPRRYGQETLDFSNFYYPHGEPTL